jgi:hypothetical protein
MVAFTGAGRTSTPYVVVDVVVDMVVVVNFDGDGNVDMADHR